MVTEAHAEPVRARRHISEFVMPAVGLTLVALVVVWLCINLVRAYACPVRGFNENI